MKTKIWGIVVSVLIFSAASALCADWEIIGYGMNAAGEKTMDSYLGGAQRTPEGTIKAHVKQIYTSVGIKEMRSDMPDCSYSVYTIEVSCTTEEYRVTNMADFDKNDNMLKSYKQEDLAEENWVRIETGSLAEIYFEDLCGKKLRAASQ